MDGSGNCCSSYCANLSCIHLHGRNFMDYFPIVAAASLVLINYFPAGNHVSENRGVNDLNLFRMCMIVGVLLPSQ